MFRIRTAVLLGTLLLLFLKPTSAAQTRDLPQVLIINQVRGEECCGTGSLDFLRMQTEALVNNGIPGYFALRYDALQNQEYVAYLKEISNKNPQIINLGLLLEVTPSLAKEAGVSYSAPEDAWYEAQHVYSIGYSNDENKKMMDLIFKTFHDEFGYYPEITSSWMIKTDTLTYIHNSYGVIVHQITKEQFGTDSYTLYGGPAHYPYPASQKWAFIPDFNDQSAPVIVRQTVTDPLFNYGNLSAYTSQPNDYAADGKSFAYFKDLVNQALFEQPQQGFALLGLETSMDKKHQQEFINQIKYIGELHKNKKITLPDASTIKTYWNKKPYTVYQGSEIIHNTKDSAYWIDTPSYRFRLKISKNNVYITDIRYFDPEYMDPYQSKAAQRDGFWIVPYILDASESETKNEKIAFKRINDTDDLETYIQLPKIKDNVKPIIKINPNNISFSYIDSSQKNRTITFLKDEISFPFFTANEIIPYNNRSSTYPIRLSKEKNGFSFSWKNGDVVFLSILNECTNEECNMTFASDPSQLEEARNTDYAYLFPEPSYRTLSPKNTDIYLNNQFAVANRNPSRLVIDPRDEYGIKTNLPIKEIHITTNKDL